MLEYVVQKNNTGWKSVLNKAHGKMVDIVIKFHAFKTTILPKIECYFTTCNLTIL